MCLFPIHPCFDGVVSLNYGFSVQEGQNSLGFSLPRLDVGITLVPSPSDVHCMLTGQCHRRISSRIAGGGAQLPKLVVRMPPGPRTTPQPTVGVNKVTGVIESFPSNLNTFWKSLNILHLSYLDG